MLPETWATVSTRRSWVSERKTYRGNVVGDHFAGVVECGHRERLSHRLALCRIKAYSPDIEEAAARGYEIDRLSIRRPLRFVVPAFAVRDAYPWSAGGGSDKDCGSGRVVVSGEWLRIQSSGRQGSSGTGRVRKPDSRQYFESQLPHEEQRLRASRRSADGMYVLDPSSELF